MFRDGTRLKEIYSLGHDSSSESICNFPLQMYEDFLKQIIKQNIKVITYRDLFAQSDDWDYLSGYSSEFKAWKEQERDPQQRYLLIQHDIDAVPEFTKRIVAMEAFYGIRSNIFMFREQFLVDNQQTAYDIDHEFFQDAQKQGFVIGYHQNAFALAGFDMEKAIERYKSDVEYLRQYYNIDFVVPHGGIGAEIDGQRITNCDVPIPEEFKGNLRWVYNRYGVKFTRRWSDGGLRITRDLKRIEGFDIVGKFLPSLKPGTRNFCLTHPQRWGYNVDPLQNPMLAEESWYKEVCLKYAAPGKRNKSPQST